MTGFEECVRGGFLRKIPPSHLQSEEQMKKSRTLLEESEKSLKAGLPNSAVMAAYSAVLDSARALLFRDGYREKSHVCVVKYLEAKYAEALGATEIGLFDRYRDLRHKTTYSGEYYPTMEEAARVVSFAAGFVSKVERILHEPQIS